MLYRSGPIWLFAFSLLSLLFILPSTSAASSTSSLLCKCSCFTNSTIIPLFPPSISDSKHPCLSCTKSFCLEQKLEICKGASLGSGDLDTGTGKEGDVEAKCIKRDSPRDQIIVTCFLFVVVGLLGSAFIKNKLEQAGWDSRKFTEGGWWRDAIASLPARATGRQESETRQGSYAPVSVGS
ncbi:hypothetical protein BDY24DRAFT_374522 [Mrakia frigida]|uniref:uncharacterized protein n=1 Tax=Mrakia frigida TaxID=29902 RepID=UPI003FCBF00C